MYEQMTLEDALAAGQQGMAAAEDAMPPWFREEADRFITRFARSCVKPFSSEELVAAANACGLSVREERAWGAAFQRAARAGVIRRSSETYRRAKGNGSIGLKWERVL